MPSPQKKAAGGNPSGGLGENLLRDLEVEARAEAHGTRRLDLSDLATATANGAVRPEQRLTLKDRALVRRVEEIRRERHAHAVEEAEVLRRAEIELVDVREARRADRVGNDVDTATREAPRTSDAILIRRRVALACGQARADIEVPRELIETGHVEVPARVDEHVAKRAGTGRTNHDLPRCAVPEERRRVGE